METIEEFNDNFDVKKTKKKGFLITVIVIIALVIALIATYFLIFTKPQFIFSKAIDKLFGERKEISESIKLDYTIKPSVDTNNKEIEEYTKDLEKFSLNFGTQIDVKSKQEIVNLGLKYNNEEVIDAQVYYDNENMYAYLNELFDKYIEIDVPEEQKESIEKVFEMIEPEKQKKTIKIEKILKNEIKEQIKKEGEFEKTKETIKIDGEEQKTNKYTLKLSKNEIINIISNTFSNLAENEEFIKYFGDDTFEDSLKEAAKTLEKNTKGVDKDKFSINIEIHIYTKGLFNEIVGADVETNISADSQNIKTILKLLEEDEDKYSYEIKMKTAGVNVELVSGIVEIEKEKDNKKEKEGTINITAKVAIAQLEAKLEIDYLIEYDNGIDKIDTSNSVRMDEITEEEIETIIQELKKRPLIGDIIRMEESLFEQAQTALEETKKAQIQEAIALAKAEFLSAYYTQGIKLEEITEEKVKEAIEEYLYEPYNIKVTKTPGKVEFIITVEGIELEQNKIDLSNLNPIF